MTVSSLYAGTIRHRRFAERERSFEHAIALAYIDLDELPTLLGGRLLANRPGLVRFRRDDYFGTGDLAAAIREHTGVEAQGGVRILTQLRTWGICFNPVSFYYCFDEAGGVEAVLAEVTNTPWGERQPYVVKDTGRVLGGESEKLMHVSPFFGMEQRYRWRVTQPGETLAVHIENWEEGEKAFDATLNLKRRELSYRALARNPQSARILGLIYGHAAATRLAGVKPRPHPQTGGTVPYA